jgi:uncharacterized membrane protein YgcG
VTGYGDHEDVPSLRRDVPADDAVLSAAGTVLRALVQDAPPPPSAALARVIAAGLPSADGRGRVTAWAARTAGKVAGLGAAAKLLLAAGVAVAGVGGATTAVELSHPAHSPSHPRIDTPPRARPQPTPTPAAPAARVPRPTTSAVTSRQRSEDGERHPSGRPGTDDGRQVDGGRHGGDTSSSVSGDGGSSGDSVAGDTSSTDSGGSHHNGGGSSDGSGSGPDGGGSGGSGSGSERGDG